MSTRRRSDPERAEGHVEPRRIDAPEALAAKLVDQAVAHVVGALRRIMSEHVAATDAVEAMPHHPSEFAEARQRCVQADAIEEVRLVAEEKKRAHCKP